MKLPGRWKSLSEIEARQRNTVWPDTLRNGALVDAFVWRGSPNATYIQGAGPSLQGWRGWGLAHPFRGGAVAPPFSRWVRKGG